MNKANAESIKADEEKEKLRANIRKSGDKQALADASMFLSSMGESNRAFFEAWKALEIAKVVASTYSSAQAAYENGMIAGGPFGGPILAAAYAAAAVAAGTANIQAIMSASPGSATVSSVASTSAAGSALISDTGISPYDVTPMTEEEETKGSMNIYIEGDMLADEYYIERMAEKISEAVESYDVRLVATSSKTADALA